MANRFYASFAPTPGTVVLQGPEARHLATVMRGKPGDRVVLFCGDGCEYPAIIESVGKRDVTLSVSEAQSPSRELPIYLEVAAATPKGDRGDFLIEKLTELGVTRFVPLATERSVVHPRIDRLQRAVIEASKQCGRNVLMDIGEVVEWREYCRSVNGGARKWIAHVRDGDVITPLPCPLPQGGRGQNRNPEMSNDECPKKVMIAVGPEGGWTDKEVKLAEQCGWMIIGLGPRVLRIETAAIALASYFALSSAINA